MHRAASVDLSVRRGYHFLLKFILGKPTDAFGGAIKLPRRLKQLVDGLLVRALVGKPSQYGLPAPDYRLYESHPVMNSLVLHHIGHGDIRPRGDITAVSGQHLTFANGEQAEYDLILMATGYRLDDSFIARDELNWPQNAGAPQLYLNVFHPKRDDLLMLDMVETSGLGWQGRDEQAELGKAVRRCSGELADFIGIDVGYLRVGDRADLVLIDSAGLDDTLYELHEAPMEVLGLVRVVKRNDATVALTMINGRIAYRRGLEYPDGLGKAQRYGHFLPARDVSPRMRPARAFEPASAS